MSITLVVQLDIKPDCFDQFVEIVTRHGAFSKETEDGCLDFIVLKPEDGEHRLLLVETYRDREALNSHWDSAHMNAYREKTGEMIIARHREICEVLG